MFPKGCNFREMKQGDLSAVLEIIYDHDEDDGESAEESFGESGFADHYVAVWDGDVVGVTGFSAADGTDGAYWLSWTYVDEDYQGRKIGTAMVTQIIEILKKRMGRKLFVSLSDYVDPEDGPIYENALKLYRSVGFKEEIVHADYYAPGESQMIYGFTLSMPLPGRNQDDTRPICLGEVFEIDETDDIYAIDWEFTESESFGSDALGEAVSKAKKAGGRAVFIAFPSNVISVLDILKTSGFEPCGMLEDFYKDGLHEFRFRLDLN